MKKLNIILPGILLLSVLLVVGLLLIPWDVSEPSLEHDHTHASSTTIPHSHGASQGSIHEQEKPVSLQMQLLGPDMITVEYGQEYVEQGAEALCYTAGAIGKPEELEVEISGMVNTKKLGVYHLTYTAEKNGNVIKRNRTVRVVDTQPPEITLVTNPDTFTLPGEHYREEGYTAIDACDGDLTDKVQRVFQDGKVIYTVTDASGNQAQVVREIVYDDRTPPTLSLIGSEYMVITAGSKYAEPGYWAMDNCDGDITSRVIITGRVDTYRVGTYVLTYTVTDSYGNSATRTRTVRVEAVGQPDRVEPSGRTIYLTFDDGPGPYTQELLDILDKYNVKATFFVVNTSYMHLLPEMVRRGHSIGIHSINHRYSQIYANEDAYFQDLYGMQDIIYQWIGQRTTLMRFPGGSSNVSSKEYCLGLMTKLVKSVTDQGFQYYDWNVTSGDVGSGNTADLVYENVIRGIGNKDVAVVLQHDIHKHSVDAVERIIQWGLANGYSFQALTPESPKCQHNFLNN